LNSSLNRAIPSPGKTLADLEIAPGEQVLDQVAAPADIRRVEVDVTRQEPGSVDWPQERRRLKLELVAPSDGHRLQDRDPAHEEGALLEVEDVGSHRLLVQSHATLPHADEPVVRRPRVPHEDAEDGRRDRPAQSSDVRRLVEGRLAARWVDRD